MEKIPFLIEILPYVQKFRNTTFVVKLGGDSARNPKILESLAKDLTLLHNIRINIVLVHGGGPQADELLQKLGHGTKKVNGRRITDEQTLDVAKMVYAGKVNTEIVAALQHAGTHTIGLTGADCNLITAEKRKPQKVKNKETGKTETVDFGYVGDIRSVNTELIKQVLKENCVPVIACLGIDSQGTVLNINADSIAEEIAKALKAEKFISITNVPGILENREDKTSTMSYLNLPNAKKLLKNSKVNGGMLPKLQSCVGAVEGGVKRAHIIDMNTPHGILVEVLTNQGCGTMIVSKQEEAEYKETG